MSDVKKTGKPYSQYSKTNKSGKTTTPKSAKPYAEYSRNVHDRRNPVPLIIGATALVLVVIGVVAFLLRPLVLAAMIVLVASLLVAAGVEIVRVPSTFRRRRWRDTRSA